jgi:hypothetical protein
MSSSEQPIPEQPRSSDSFDDLASFLSRLDRENDPDPLSELPRDSSIPVPVSVLSGMIQQITSLTIARQRDRDEFARLLTEARAAAAAIDRRETVLPVGPQVTAVGRGAG